MGYTALRRGEIEKAFSILCGLTHAADADRAVPLLRESTKLALYPQLMYNPENLTRVPAPRSVVLCAWNVASNVFV